MKIRKEVKMTIRNNLYDDKFIKNQKADADAAYKRLAIIRKHLKEMEAEINATNIVDICGEHLHLYEELRSTMKLICLQEQQLILMGE